MKFIYFIIVLIIFYLIATQIKFVHLDSLPREKQIKLKKKSEARSLVTEGYVKDTDERDVSIFGVNNTVENYSNDSSLWETNKLIPLTNRYSGSQYNSRDYKNNYWDLTNKSIDLPNANNLYFLIKSEYRDQQYNFNISNQPVTTRHSSSNTIDIDSKYLKYARKEINRWNEIFPKYYQTNRKMLTIRDIKLLFVMETINEFLIELNASLLYLGKTIHFHITYYGQIDRNDDFLNGGSDIFILQLVDLKPIPKSEFDITFQPMNETDQGPFMSMKQQLQYVDRINKLHRDESKEYL